MTKNLLEQLTDLIHTNEIYKSETGILKNKLIEDGFKNDPSLIQLLLSSPSLKIHFFTELEGGILIFNSLKFQQFLSLKDFLPDSYTSFKNKIGLTDENGDYLSQNKNVVLNFPFKDCVLEGGQTKDDAKRKEIFWNETLAPDEIDVLLEPKLLTNAKKYTPTGEIIATTFNRNAEGVITDNLIIKGNNLIALHSLKKEFKGKVKLIYIDPPYNTDSSNNTFAYNNTFNRSTWLVFMKNRLEVAKTLLKKEEGVLVTAIDDHEFASLKLLLEETFREYTHETVVVNHHPAGSGGLNISTTHEYAIFSIPSNKKVLKGLQSETEIDSWSLIKTGAGSDYFRVGRPKMFYSILVDDSLKVVGVGDEMLLDEKYENKSVLENLIRIYPIDSKGNERRWRYGRKTMLQLIEERKITCSKNYSLSVVKDRSDYNKPVYSLWTNSRYNASSQGTSLLRALVPNTKFSFPKSLYTVLDTIAFTTDTYESDIILDFFGGSGTTAHAVLELNKEDSGNRQFIICEQMDYINSVTVPRVRKVIENNQIGEFIYCELKQHNQGFVEQIENAENQAEIKLIWEDIQRSGFLSYKVDTKLINANVSEFDSLSHADQKKFLIEVLDKNMLYVNFSDIDNADYPVNAEEKLINQSYYKGKK